ncbi:pilus assembly protein N-terminal domain-containing protein [Microvirga sp. GCM10011540]|uniref:pilus assembly protein N-terminal domain-containing protein n=1 Tax=Microvirga sp. GCM10011540 TaxID=3317338 RepID=UPI0036214BE5
MNRYAMLAALAVPAFAVVSTPCWADGKPRETLTRSEGVDVAAVDNGASVVVRLDFAKVLMLSAPARTIIIGNPDIVDGTLSDERSIVLTGKATGATNLIVLGEGGREIANLLVRVSSGGRQLTTVYHGAEPKTFSCIGSCAPVRAVGAGTQGQVEGP